MGEGFKMQKTITEIKKALELAESALRGMDTRKQFLGLCRVQEALQKTRELEFEFKRGDIAE
jgi:hypothetical protein